MFAVSVASRAVEFSTVPEPVSTVSDGVLRASNALALGLGATTVSGTGIVEINNLTTTSGTLDYYCIDHWTRELGVDIGALHREVRSQVAWLPGAREIMAG